MITEGIIKTIEYNSNKCTVRIPLFEKASLGTEVVLNSRIIVQPGVFNCYKENDSVWVAFVEDKENLPVVIGKIYKSPKDELKVKGGHANFSSLIVSGDSVKLPMEATFESNSGEFITFKDMLEELKELQQKVAMQASEIYDLNIRLNENNFELMEYALKDSEGEIIYDSDGQMMIAKYNTKE